MIIRLKQYSLNTKIGTRNTKPHVFGFESSEIISKNGIRFKRRLDENINPNFGQELRNLQREKSELSRGLGGKNMTTYKLKRYSKIQKTYTLKRKTFGVGDTVGNAASSVGKGVNRAVGTVENVAGGVASGTGKAMDSFVGKNVVGVTGGTILGASVAPTVLGALGGPLGTVLGYTPLGRAVGGTIGGILGHSAMKLGGGIAKDVGEGLKEDAVSRK